MWLSSQHTNIRLTTAQAVTLFYAVIAKSHCTRGDRAVKLSVIDFNATCDFCGKANYKRNAPETKEIYEQTL